MGWVRALGINNQRCAPGIELRGLGVDPFDDVVLAPAPAEPADLFPVRVRPGSTADVA